MRDLEKKRSYERQYQLNRRKADPEYAQKHRDYCRWYKQARKRNGGKPLGRKLLPAEERTPEARRAKVTEYMRGRRAMPKERERSRRDAKKWREQHREEWLAKHRQRRAEFTADGRPKIYFIQVTSGPIKIGFTTMSMAARMQGLQCGNHEAITLLKVTGGTRGEEVKIHDRFLADRIRPRGEWFRCSKGLLEYIASLPDLPPLKS